MRDFNWNSVYNLYLESDTGQMKLRGMVMIGALLRDSFKTMKIVTGYKCTQRGEFVQFGGDHQDSWYPLEVYEILSLDP